MSIRTTGLLAEARQRRPLLAGLADAEAVVAGRQLGLLLLLAHLRRAARSSTSSGRRGRRRAAGRRARGRSSEPLGLPVRRVRARPCPGPRPSPGRASAACRRSAARCRRRSARGRCPRSRRMNWPPCWRANARLNSDMYAVPTCGSPVGDGATRTRTGRAPAGVSHGPPPGWSGCRPARSVTLTSSPTASGPTPAGVPVRMTSPGSSVMAVVTCEIELVDAAQHLRGAAGLLAARR